MSSNFTGFVYKFSPVDQYLCPLFKNQDCQFHFSLVKLCTLELKIFHNCEFACKFLISDMYFLTHV